MKPAISVGRTAASLDIAGMSIMGRLCEFASVRNRESQFFVRTEIFIELKRAFANRHFRHVADVREGPLSGKLVKTHKQKPRRFAGDCTNRTSKSTRLAPPSKAETGQSETEQRKRGGFWNRIRWIARESEDMIKISYD